MKLYLAHNFAAREWLQTQLPRFAERGHEVTSRWITDDSHLDQKPRGQINSAKDDLEDVISADGLVLFTDQWGDRAGRGKYVEFGYALRQGMKIYLVGESNTNCVFYFCPGIKQYKNVDELLEAL